ncbi:MAG TPA: hypothetical protein PLP33_07455 [Leptospiraceae bacterium]|nr:hypothetical protein [Leptospiraceae bacterium]
MQTPYRKNELSIVSRSTESTNFFCRWFGCRISKQTIPNGIYILENQDQKTIFSFQNCEICKREFAKKFEKSQFIQLFKFNGREEKYKFIKFEYKADDIKLSSNNIDDEHEAEIRYVYRISEIRNLEYNHIKYKFICSNIGCKYRTITDDYDLVLFKECLRCGKFVQEE